MVKIRRPWRYLQRRIPHWRLLHPQMPVGAEPHRLDVTAQGGHFNVHTESGNIYHLNSRRRRTGLVSVYADRTRLLDHPTLVFLSQLSTDKQVVGPPVAQVGSRLRLRLPEYDQYNDSAVVTRIVKVG